MATVSAVFAIDGFVALFGFADTIIHPIHARLANSRMLGVCGSLASLAMMAVGAHIGAH